MVMEICLIALVFVVLAGLLVAFAGRITSMALPMIPREVDDKLGAAIFMSVETTTSACTAPEALSYVQALGAPLEAAVADKSFSFRYFVADDPIPNAFALPGGYIIVNRGLVEAAKESAEVAGVLAHELEHVIQRHSTTRALKQASVSILFQLFFSGTSLHAPAQIYNKFSTSSFSRAQESDADEKGAALLVRAGIDPAALGRFLTRISEGSVNIPEWLSSHPDSPARAHALEAYSLGGPPVELPSLSSFRCHPQKAE